MKGAAALLTLGAPRAARWLCLRFLDEAREARVRLDDPSDPEGLHDFRVALRRLRSTVRAYRDHLESSIGGKDRRRLRALAHATGASRDGEVMIAWVAAQREHVPVDAHPGADWLDARLRKRQEKLTRDLLREVTRDFAREHGRLSEQLGGYRTTVALDDPREAPAMSAALAELVSAQAAELRSCLAEIGAVDEQEAAHECRIDAKRLRYLLEPFAEDLPDARDIVKRIKKMQDLLGDMHDAHVAGQLVAAERAAAEQMDTRPDPDPVPGLDALAERARVETERLFDEAREKWFGGAADAFFADVDALVAKLRAGGEDREIERKFLLKSMPTLPEGAVRTDLAQGYLPGERLQERVRRVRRGGELKFYRTIKTGSGLSRMELEEETTDTIFRRLWALTKGRRIRKQRFRVAEGELTWEIDRFRGRRLFLAEVELPSEDTEVPIPEWLAPHIDRDVTGESEYVNVNLAR